MVLLSINMGEWLLQQSPVIVVMGVAIWWLAKQLMRKEAQLEQISEKAIQLATKWEEKAEHIGDKNKESHQLIMDTQKIIADEIAKLKTD